MGRVKTLDEWLSYQENLHTTEIDLGLERIQKVYQLLFPKGVAFKVITVAGTNGKGSTIAFIDSIYQQTNFKIAKFTSPHILQYNERFAVNGVLVSDEKICAAFETIEQVRGEISLTYFEFSTLAALLIFSEFEVDIALLEIGLGGRLDSVNVLDSDVAVITSIDIDHIDYLGDTRELIGLEKAGIMRANTPCVCGDLNPPKTIAESANKIGALLTFTNTPYLGKIGLQGKHQQYNAALAIEVVNQLKTFPITQDQLSIGVENVELAARFQVKNINNKIVILDVAHNPAATKVLSDMLKKDKQPTIAIFSALENKNIAKMIEIISPLIEKWLLVPLNASRATTMQTLVQKFPLSSNIKSCKDMSTAIHQALNTGKIQRVVIFGSFHTVADALKVIE